MSAPLFESDNMQLAPGAIVGGKYRIDGFLGAGGMGVVLSATHLELDAPVAIKIVRDDLAKDERIVSRLLFEARAAARMRSAHIVRVLDVAHLDSGAPYIVMEYLEGSDLHSVLAERGVLSIREAIHHVLQACEGLAEAHGLGIVHRDLKPENLFLATTPEGVVLKILDFGISKDIAPTIESDHCSTLTKDGSAVGSPYYMSPEQMRVSPSLDARADIWSLGAILFELLTGKCPFEADSPAELCTKVLVDDAPSLRSFSNRAPAELDTIVLRCLQKDPSARFQSVTDLADALRDFVAEADRAAAGHAAADSAAFESRLVDPKPAELRPIEAAATEPTPTNFTPGEPSPALAARKLRYAWLGVSALLVSAAFGYWRFWGTTETPERLADHRASAVTLSAGAPPVPRQEPSPKRQAPPVASPSPSPSVTVSVVVAPPASAAITAPASAASPRATAPRHAAAGPRFYTPRREREPEPVETPPDTDSPETRYGL
jgi:serine/threonine-protein kinase